MIRENPITNEEQIIDGRTQKKSSEPVWKDFMWACISCTLRYNFLHGSECERSKTGGRKAEAVKRGRGRKEKAEKEEKKKEKEAEEQRKKELVQPVLQWGQRKRK